MTRRAVLVGINYVNGKNPLQGCVNDVKSVEQILKHKYLYENVVILTNELATRTNILAEFTKLLSEAVAGDSLFFLYSGHGFHIKDTSYDEVDGYDELIVCNDSLPIIDDELRQIIMTNLKVDVQLFALFDSCLNGTIFDLKYNSYLMTTIDIPETVSNVFALSTSSDFQNSAETLMDGTYQGAGTWAFLQVMTATPEPLLMDIVKEMRTLLVSKGFRQYPQLSWGKKIDVDGFRLVL